MIGDLGGERVSLTGLAPRPLSSLTYPGDREPMLSYPGQVYTSGPLATGPSDGLRNSRNGNCCSADSLSQDTEAGEEELVGEELVGEEWELESVAVIAGDDVCHCCRGSACLAGCCFRLEQGSWLWSRMWRSRDLREEKNSSHRVHL